MGYKTELHCHTSEVSGCSRETGAEVAAKYIEHGYTTLVVTNHFTRWTFDGDDRGDTWEKKLDWFYDAVDLVRKAAGGKLFVLDGLELHLNNDPTD